MSGGDAGGGLGLLMTKSLSPFDQLSGVVLERRYAAVVLAPARGDRLS